MSASGRRMLVKGLHRERYSRATGALGEGFGFGLGFGFGFGFGLGLGLGFAPVRRRVAAARGQLGERRGEGARLAAANGHAVARVGGAVL